MKISGFAKKIAVDSGIGRLMEDLGAALSQKRDMLMLGGGNPAHIPQVEESCRLNMLELLENPSKFAKAIGDYDPPQGNIGFIEAITKLLNEQLGWNIKTENVALTNGSQTAFFLLFNMFAGRYEDGRTRKILFPIAPEYIGYCDVALENGLFTAKKSLIEIIDEYTFKYHVDFENLKITDEIGAMCSSRPTNPSGNVLTDSEIIRLSELAAKNEIPLIVDNAYGAPFPNVIFTDAAAIWNSNIVFCMSLSKLGLPTARTGIIIASREIISLVAKANAVMSLAPGGLGPAIATEMAASGEIIRLANDVIRPYYQKKSEFAMKLFIDKLKGLDFLIHKSEGAFFLWLWFRNLPISSFELYQRLKARGVIVVSGHYFFPGMEDQWQHKDQCIRVNYCPDEITMSKAAEIIADEVKIAYGKP
ncbi:MAG: valine--pyruvate transaminase [Phycisphaerae bacterium]